MRSISVKRSILPTVVGGIALFVGGVVAIVGTLAATGWIELPFFKKATAAPPPADYRGMVLVPVNARTIPAYTRVTRDYLLDLKTAQLKFVALPAGKINPKIILDPTQILGRVMSYEKPVGRAFEESDFLPRGTRPGLVAGIPYGKRALDIEADKIKGIQSLRAGDHFDLVSSLPLDTKNKAARTPFLVPLGMPPQQLKRVAVDLLAQDAIVVSAVAVRKIDTGPPSPRTGIAPSKVVHEVVIAVDPDEVEGVMESLALKAEVTCFARSGRPEDPNAAALTGGMVAVPVAAKPVPGYSQITSDFFLNPRTRKPQVVFVRPEDVPSGTAARLDQLLGRVTRKDQPAGHIFTEDDFFPRGTRPGIVGGIPPGKRAVEVDASRIKGIYSLKAGDCFDLVAAMPLDPNKNTGRNVVITSGGRLASHQKRATVEVVVHCGMVVVPVTTKFLQTGSPFSANTDSSTKTIQEVVLALDPKEAAALSAALALKAEITCIARSGRPEDPGAASVTPGLKPPITHVIEVITGGKRQLYEFPEPVAEKKE